MTVIPPFRVYTLNGLSAISSSLTTYVDRLPVWARKLEWTWTFFIIEELNVCNHGNSGLSIMVSCFKKLCNPIPTSLCFGLVFSYTALMNTNNNNIKNSCSFMTTCSDNHTGSLTYVVKLDEIPDKPGAFRV